MAKTDLYSEVLRLKAYKMYYLTTGPPQDTSSLFSRLNIKHHCKNYYMWNGKRQKTNRK